MIIYVQRVKDPVANVDSAVDILLRYSTIPLYVIHYCSNLRMVLYGMDLHHISHPCFSGRSLLVDRTRECKAPGKHQEDDDRGSGIILSVLSGQFSLILSHIPVQGFTGPLRLNTLDRSRPADIQLKVNNLDRSTIHYSLACVIPL
jgi:hypothetical protein